MTLTRHKRAALHHTLIGIAVVLWAGACAAQAEEFDRDKFRISGFGTLGVVHSDAPAGWSFLRDMDQPGNSAVIRGDVDSRFGLQVNYTATPRLELVAQVLAKRRLPDADASEAIEWAMAAYRPNADVTLRAGRLNVDQFLMSDYRNVGFAYAYARPPVEYYGAIPTALDGIDVARIWDTNRGRWRAKGFFGRTQVLGMKIRPVLGGTVSYEEGALFVRAGLSRTRFATTPPSIQPLLDGLSQLSLLPEPQVAAEAAALRSRLDFAGEPITYGQVGINYEPDQWLWTAEITRLSAGPNFSFLAGYVRLGRRMGPVTVFGVVSGAKAFAPPAAAVPDWATPLTPLVPPLDPGLPGLAQFIGTQATHASNLTNDQHTFSLGARWDFHAQMALKVQWDRVRIRANGGVLWSNTTPEPGRADIGSIVLDFVF